MPVGPVNPKQMAAVQADLLAELRREQAPTANVTEATTIHDTGLVVYRERTYLVPPVPAREGMQLAALRQELFELAPELADGAIATDRLQAALALVEAMLSLLGALVREPGLQGHWRRFWRWCRGQRFSPFVNAEMGELLALLRFFSVTRTRYPVRASTSIRAPAIFRQTWPTPSRTLRIGIHAGWRHVAPGRATPAVTATSSSASRGSSMTATAPC